LRIGEIETGNSSPLEAAVQLVAAQRHFETSMQALNTYRRMDERASEVGRTR
jgi:flagellar basal-body rod protein FlgF